MTTQNHKRKISAEAAKKQKPRPDNDYYGTPFGVIWATLSRLHTMGVRPKRILDFCAGKGRWGAIAREVWPDAWIEGVDLVYSQKPAAFDQWTVANALEWKSPVKFDLILSNPPFNILEAVIRAAHQHMARMAYMAILARSDVRAGVNRAEYFWPDVPLYADMPVVPRIKFEGYEGTDQYDYAVFLWRTYWSGKLHQRNAHGVPVSLGMPPLRHTHDHHLPADKIPTDPVLFQSSITTIGPQQGALFDPTTLQALEVAS